MDIFDMVAGAIKVSTEIKQSNQRLNTINCPKCGYVLPKAAMFCSRCGNKAFVERIQNGNNAPNQQSPQGQPNQKNPQPQQQARPQVYLCAGCGAPLPFEKRNEIVVCQYCDLQNYNPYYEKPTPGPITGPRPGTSGPVGHARFLYESTSALTRNITITVKQTGERIDLTNGESREIQLKPGTYTLGFNFGGRKYYERPIRIYSRATAISISCASGKTRNAINISYADGIFIPEYLMNFGRYRPDDYIQSLYELGFVNIDKRPKAGGMFDRLASYGRVADVLVEEKSLSYALENPDGFSGVGEVITNEGCPTGVRIPQEAKIVIVC